MSVDEGWLKILNPDNDLRRSLAFGGSPWKVEVERVMGIEPTLEAWEAAVLPLNHTRGSRNDTVVPGATQGVGRVLLRRVAPAKKNVDSEHSGAYSAYVFTEHMGAFIMIRSLCSQQGTQQCQSVVPPLPRPMRMRLGLLASYLLFVGALFAVNLLQQL